ncbi:MAG: DUF3795 domain-containing protein [Candidatus Hodarchaeota archaeon]
MLLQRHSFIVLKRTVYRYAMDKDISLCGFNCGLCPAYKSNLKSDKDRDMVDEGWKRFHRSGGWIYDKPYCEGCFNTSDRIPLWSNCPIRKCALKNDVRNCGYCLDYPCPRINWLIHITTLIAKRTKKEGTQEDYERFALPYLNKARLDEIHERISRAISEAEFQPLNTSTVPYPSHLNLKAFSGMKIKPDKLRTAMRKLHSTLESMLTLHCKTRGGQEQEVRRKKEGLKFLWIMGRYGKLKNGDDPLIEITGEEIKKQLKYGRHRIKKKLQELKDYGIEGNYVENEIEVRFVEKPNVAVALQQYITILLKNHSERKAFSKFWKADMSVLS